MKGVCFIITEYFDITDELWVSCGYPSFGRALEYLLTLNTNKGKLISYSISDKENQRVVVDLIIKSRYGGYKVKTYSIIPVECIDYLDFGTYHSEKYLAEKSGNINLINILQ